MRQFIIRCESTFLFSLLSIQKSKKLYIFGKLKLESYRGSYLTKFENSFLLDILIFCWIFSLSVFFSVCLKLFKKFFCCLLTIFFQDKTSANWTFIYQELQTTKIVKNYFLVAIASTTKESENSSRLKFSKKRDYLQIHIDVVYWTELIKCSHTYKIHAECVEIQNFHFFNFTTRNNPASLRRHSMDANGRFCIFGYWIFRIFHAF